MENGRIVAVEKIAGSNGMDVGAVALVPGFVNTHVHLDLPAMAAGSTPPASFASWLRSVVASRQNMAASIDDVIQLGVEASIASGTTLVGDIATTNSSRQWLEKAALSATVFREILGWKRERFEPLWFAALTESATSKTVDICDGISPHAPYSTHPSVYRRTSTLPTEVGRATHWLETEEEIDFIRHRRGPIRDFLETLGAWNEAIDVRCADDWADRLVDPGPWILVHGNYISDADIERMKRPEWKTRIAGVVYCPRTHAFFGHPPHPWKQLRAAGISVALGTDSLASNPDLSVFREAQFLRQQFPEEPASTWLRMATLSGAKMLGRVNETGVVAVGKRADLAMIAPGALDPADPSAMLFAPEAKVVGTMIAGRWRYRAF